MLTLATVFPGNAYTNINSSVFSDWRNCSNLLEGSTFLKLFMLPTHQLYLFIDRSESLLLHVGFLWFQQVEAPVWLRCSGFSLWWLFLLESTGSSWADFITCSARAQSLPCTGLVAPAARGIFPDQGLKQHPLHCKVDSQPLENQGSPHPPA